MAKIAEKIDNVLKCSDDETRATNPETTEIVSQDVDSGRTFSSKIEHENKAGDETKDRLHDILEAVLTLINKANIARTLGIPIASGTNFTGLVGSDMKRCSDEITRDALAATIDAKDRVTELTPRAFQFLGAARKLEGTGFIVGASIKTNKAGITPRFRLHLYYGTADPAGTTADGAAYAEMYVQNEKYIGFIDFPAMQSEGAGSDTSKAQNMDVRIPYVLAAAPITGSTDDIWGDIEALDAFAADASQKFRVTILTSNN